MNVYANHKVTISLALHFEKVVELQVSVEVSNGGNHNIGCDPDVALATALADTGTHFQSTVP